MATMKAVRLESFGGPETLRIVEIERPQPRDDEVLVEVHAASVNPVDYKIRSGKYPPIKQENLPIVLGRDLSGVVVARGAAVATLLDGDEVMAMLDRGSGSYAEYVALRADLCMRKPELLDHGEAAAVPLAGITAWQGLFEHGGLAAAQRVLIHGGAGGVGHFAVQFAKARDAYVITTCAGKDKDFVRSLGADEAIDYRAERFEDVVNEVDLVFDLVGGDTQERSWAVLKDGGTLVSTLAKPSERQAQIHEARAMSYVAHPDAAQLGEIVHLITEKKVRPHVDARFPLAQVAAAHEKLEHGHPRGKIVLEVRSG
ncbi:MAG TPA: NADP-dependent oxidoreductase [Steroidobacteraceae bacterium]|jgi:NADPH:quinone reductase-like Zn-dependent oxidoreductase|nr:NADP-dependent oxidoreductase [Steroidobacteraceae bacterium]